MNRIERVVIHWEKSENRYRLTGIYADGSSLSRYFPPADLRGVFRVIPLVQEIFGQSIATIELSGPMEHVLGLIG